MHSNKYNIHNLVISEITKLNSLVLKIIVGLKFFKESMSSYFIQWHPIVFSIIDGSIQNIFIIPNGGIYNNFIIIPDRGIYNIIQNYQFMIWTIHYSHLLQTNTNVSIQIQNITHWKQIQFKLMLTSILLY